MDTLIVYPNGTDKPGLEFKCANGFVSRVVSAIANSDQMGCLRDAMTVCGILNREAYAAAIEAAAVARQHIGANYKPGHDSDFPF